AIGTAHPVSLSVETFGTHRVDPDRLGEVIRELFDFRPAAIIRDLDLRRPIYRETAAYGPFGRKGFSWEETDRADDLRRTFDSRSLRALGPRRSGRRLRLDPAAHARSSLHLCATRRRGRGPRKLRLGSVPRAHY